MGSGYDEGALLPLSWKIEPLGHQVAVMIQEAATAVEFDGTVSMVHLEMERLRAMFTGGSFRKVKKLGTNSLPAVGGFDKEFVDPGALAAVLQTEVKADDQVCDGSVLIASQKNKAIPGLVQKFDQILADREIVEGLGPRIATLHMAHQEDHGIEIGWSRRANGKRHR